MRFIIMVSINDVDTLKHDVYQRSTTIKTELEILVLGDSQGINISFRWSY